MHDLSTAFERLSDQEQARAIRDAVHVYRRTVVCDTDKRGHSNPRGLSPTELVLEATDGFIPLWAPNTRLRWRFQLRSFAQFSDPEAAKAAVRGLFGRAVLAWGGACPVRFVESQRNWDFEISVRPHDNCAVNGCVLASAFFPGGGQTRLSLYPELFRQTEDEMVETLVHELGHIFGLRHFFAQVTEKRWASEIFGDHEPFSIMNYGDASVLTETDKTDLARLYTLAWSGELTDVNGTPVRLVTPYSVSGRSNQDLVASRRIDEADPALPDGCCGGKKLGCLIWKPGD